MAFKIPEIEFYNGGDARHERFSFDQPAGDKPHAISYWVMEAPKEGFFKVPREMPTPFGGAVPVEFAKDILERFGDRGVIAIEVSGEFGDEEPWASSRDDAKKKGDAKWRGYCRTKIEEWIAENQVWKSRNLPPATASGFIKHAHKVLGLSIPQEEVFAQAASSQSDVARLEEQVRKLTELVENKGARK